jgi:SAM-dependent methyltransferase
MSEIKVEGTSCDLCGQNGTRLLYKMPDLRLRRLSQLYSVVECITCGHRYLSPRPIKEEFSNLYPDVYYIGRSADDPKQKKRYQVQAKYLADIRTGKILDVGCAEGDWISYLKDFGWACFGTDVHEPSKRIPGVDIKTGFLPELDYPDCFFDVVTAWSVMEHVSSPSAYFKTIKRILKPGGLFIFMVPNGESLWSRWAFHDDIPRHIHFFRVKTLGEYAKRNQFMINRIEHTNKIYSQPANGRGMFRRRILLKLGASWEEILGRPDSVLRKYAGYAGSLLDRLLIHPFLEEYFHMCGNMVVVFNNQCAD